MLKSWITTARFGLNSLLETITPRRKNFDIVSNIDWKTLIDLPRAQKVFEMDWIHPLFYYKDKRVKAIIWELKYRENARILDDIGKIIFDEIITQVSDIFLFDNDAEFILIPIPISNTRRHERGYNQSEYIAKAVLENDTHRSLLYAPQWFLKIKETPKQSWSQSRRDRLQNLRNSFEANPNVANKYIILIDDVVTTGSTLSEARRTLLSADARDVLAFTIAH